jgi:hypothetical protein
MTVKFEIIERAEGNRHLAGEDREGKGHIASKGMGDRIEFQRVQLPFED